MRILELADSLGLSPEDHINTLLERAIPKRRVDLMLTTGAAGDCC
jgi:hypothetical protein